MGIDTPFLYRIAEIGTKEGIFPGGDVLILGDCRFHTPWATGDNAADRDRFRDEYKLGRVETVDVFGSPSIVMDLHQQAPPELRNRFDMIIDAGTMFCCFDVATVAKNCFEMLKDDGVIVHQAALSGYYGRCYYNFHPSLFKDLYEQNGFALTNMEIRVFREPNWLARLQYRYRRWRKLPVGEYAGIGAGTFLDYADFAEMQFGEKPGVVAAMIPIDALIICAARRRERREFVRPLPSYYRDHH